MRQSSRIILFGPCKRFLKSASIATFISHRPDDDTRPILISFYQLLRPIQCCLIKFRIVRDQFIPSACPLFVCVIGIAEHPWSMAFIVSLINYKESIFIAHLIEHRLIRVMAGTNGIKIMFFHQLHILFHLVDTDHEACFRIRIMSVDSAEFDWSAINIDHTVFYSYFSNPHIFCDHFMLCLKKQRIQIWLFTVPQMRLINYKFCISLIYELCHLLIFSII